MVLNVWITVVYICCAFLEVTEGKIHKGIIWASFISKFTVFSDLPSVSSETMLEINADFECANALRKEKSSLVLLEGNVVFFKKATRKITRRGTYGRMELKGEIETFQYRLSENYKPWSIFFGDEFIFDDENDGFAVTALFGRIGADRVNENPISFHDSNFEEMRKKYSWPSSGVGMDFSAFYHYSPVRLHFRVAVETTKYHGGVHTEWKW
ncbi:hypothetical protein Y032_0008g135 [Ancylostoma ceylanicum]|uniref:Uncharacterized protein n=1 Tax=Ancylostoma ceylanicum TaxID=53326 RepID=A0A016VLR4_9BILA|nr:hypothetical protein Y032_0008g135 [Ancylostoma ceylanicum]